MGSEFCPNPYNFGRFRPKCRESVAKLLTKFGQKMGAKMAHTRCPNVAKVRPIRQFVAQFAKPGPKFRAKVGQTWRHVGGRGANFAPHGTFVVKMLAFSCTSPGRWAYPWRRFCSSPPGPNPRLCLRCSASSQAVAAPPYRKVWTGFGRLRPSSANTRPKLGRFRPNSGPKLGVNLAEFGTFREAEQHPSGTVVEQSRADIPQQMPPLPARKPVASLVQLMALDPQLVVVAGLAALLGGLRPALSLLLLPGVLLVLAFRRPPAPGPDLRLDLGFQAPPQVRAIVGSEHVSLGSPMLSIVPSAHPRKIQDNPGNPDCPGEGVGRSGRWGGRGGRPVKRSELPKTPPRQPPRQPQGQPKHNPDRPKCRAVRIVRACLDAPLQRWLMLRRHC